LIFKNNSSNDYNKY